jgi:hypothetical protein
VRFRAPLHCNEPFHRLILYRFSENNYQIKKYENTPLERFYNLLALDRKDVYQIFSMLFFVGLMFVIAAWHSSYYKLYSIWRVSASGLC